MTNRQSALWTLVVHNTKLVFFLKAWGPREFPLHTNRIVSAPVAKNSEHCYVGLLTGPLTQGTSERLLMLERVHYVRCTSRYGALVP